MYSLSVYEQNWRKLVISAINLPPLIIVIAIGSTLVASLFVFYASDRKIGKVRQI